MTSLETKEAKRGDVCCTPTPPSATTSLWVDGRLRSRHQSRDAWPHKITPREHLADQNLLCMRQPLRIHVRLDIRMTVTTRHIWIRIFFQVRVCGLDGGIEGRVIGRRVTVPIICTSCLQSNSIVISGASLTPSPPSSREWRSPDS